MSSRALIALIAAGAVAAALVALTLSIDRVVMRSIEHYGSEALGAAVTVGDVKIRLADGHGTVSGLRVAQPEGFGSGDALELGEIVIDLDVESLAAGDPYVLELVRVADPVVFYVVREDGESNLDALRRRLAESDDATEPADAGSEGSEDPVRLRIDRVEIEGGRILADVRTARTGEREAKLPSLRIDGLGGRRGLPPDELANDIGRRLVAHSLVAVTASGVGELVKRGGREVRSLLDKLVR